MIPMIFVSEINGKRFKTFEECEANDRAEEERLAAEAARRKELEELKAERYEEVVALYSEYKEAEKAYINAKSDYVSDYGHFYLKLENGNVTSTYNAW